MYAVFCGRLQQAKVRMASLDKLVNLEGCGDGGTVQYYSGGVDLQLCMLGQLGKGFRKALADGFRRRSL